MTDRLLLPENLAATSVVLTLAERPWGTWVFPYSTALGNSHVIRKLGTVETLWDDSQAVVVHKASRDLLTAVKIAGTVPKDAENVAIWAEAMRYLCASPTPELLCYVMSQSILARLCLEAGPRVEKQHCRSDDACSRRLLSDAVALLRVSPEQAHAIRDAGYDSGSLPGHPVRVVPSEFRSAEPAAEATLGALSCLATGASDPACHPFCQQQAVACLCLLTRSERGSLALLAGLPDVSAAGLVSASQAVELTGRAIRHLYAEECRREACDDGPFVPIGCLSVLRSLYVSARRSSTDVLQMIPMDKDVLRSCRFLPPTSIWCEHLLIHSVTLSEEGLRAELLRRVPWLEALDAADVPECYLTGSLLTESLVRPGGVADAEGLVGDVDVFCTDPRALDALALVVCKAVPRATNIRRASATRWRVEPVAPDDDSWSSRSDVYVNSLSTVRNYHLPHVRVAFHWRKRQLRMHPSALFGLATGINVDFTGSCGARNSFEVLERKWRAGFSVLLNTREYGQLGEYLLNVAQSSMERRALVSSLDQGTQMWPPVSPHEEGGVLDEIEKLLV